MSIAPFSCKIIHGGKRRQHLKTLSTCGVLPLLPPIERTIQYKPKKRETFAELWRRVDEQLNFQGHCSIECTLENARYWSTCDVSFSDISFCHPTLVLWMTVPHLRTTKAKIGAGRAVAFNAVLAQMRFQPDFDCTCNFSR